MRTAVINGRVITPYRIIENGYVLTDGGFITDVGSGEAPRPDSCRVVDAAGAYVAPGFIDIHTHGGGGHDYMDGTVEAYLSSVRAHLEHGTTTIIPTTLTCSNAELKNTFEVYKKAKAQNTEGAYMHGLHLEGPYFDMEMKGAQDPRYIRSPKREEYEQILSWSDDIVRWSSAPELEGAMELGRFLKKRGILPAIGHTNALYDCAEEAFENGYTLLTHFYSAMSTVRRINAFRHAGVVEAGYLIDEMDVEIIADGVHLPPTLLKMIYKIKGPSRIALITDSIRPAATDLKESVIGSLTDGMPVIVEDGVAKLADRSAFAGSVATTDRLVRTMHKMADVPIADAVRMMTSTPARIMGITDKGRLAPGMAADIVVFDEDVRVSHVILAGQVKFHV